MATTLSKREFRRELGAYIRQARITAGHTGADLATLANVSRSKLSKIELGQVRTNQATLTSLVAVLDLDREAARYLSSLRDRAESGVSAVERPSSSTHNYLYAFLASTDVWIRGCANVLPSPLQTDATVRAISENFLSLGVEPAATFRQVMHARLQIRAELYNPSKHLRLLFSEEALTTPVYGLTERQHVDQLEYVLMAAEYENVDIGIVPLQSAEARKYGPVDFTVFDQKRVSTDDPIVGFRADISNEAGSYVDLFEMLWRVAIVEEAVSMRLAAAIDNVCV
jgi:transcriptional regulator with XRE-family HTH domain